MEDSAFFGADNAGPATREYPDLGALIGSRICHDLNNPLGAIGNGLELMELAGHKAGPEVALIAQSVAAAKARLQFLRVAFGAAAPAHRMGGADVATIVAEHFAGGRTRLDWPALSELGRDEAKLAFLALMCLETALPFGGRIAVWHSAEGWRMEGRATRLRQLGALWDVAAGTAAPAGIGAPLVQFALLPEAARQVRRQVIVTQDTGKITLEV